MTKNFKSSKNREDGFDFDDFLPEMIAATRSVTSKSFSALSPSENFREKTEVFRERHRRRRVASTAEP